MKNFIKLNYLSIIFAIILFICIELMLNIERIIRLTGWSLGVVNFTVAIIYILSFISLCSISYLFISKWLKVRKANYWSVVLWFPYFMLFLLSFAEYFPITNQGEIPPPGAGLIMIGEIIFYPFLLILIIFISHFLVSKNKD